MNTSLIRFFLPLLACVAAAGAHAGAGEPDVPDVSKADFCDPQVDPVALVAAARESLRTMEASRRRVGEASVMLLEAGGELAAKQADRRSCDQVFREGRARFDKTLSGNLRRLRREAKVRPSADPDIASVQAALAERWLRDQAGRLSYLAFLPEKSSAGAGAWALRLASAHVVGADVESAQYMRGLLDRYDWIDSHRFGGKTSGQAWLLVQHADHDPAFQQRALEAMARQLDGKGVRARHYAYLYDRVAVNTDRLQRYGTQPSAECNADGSLDLRPVEDPAGLNERRRAMGLGPVAEQLAQNAAQRCR